jgi:hypothetical protein
MLRYRKPEIHGSLADSDSKMWEVLAADGKTRLMLLHRYQSVGPNGTTTNHDPK